MSATLYQRQTDWEETPEEYERRCQSASATKAGWGGTVIGLAVATISLIFLIIAK